MPQATLDRIIQQLPALEQQELEELSHAIQKRLSAPTPPARIHGLHAGAIWTSDDFDAPLPEEFWAGQ